MTIQRRDFLKACLGSGVALSLANPFQGWAQGASIITLNVGAVANLSGAGATDEMLLRDGALLRAERFNNATGLAESFSLDMHFEDSETSPVGAVNAANRLANRGDLSFVIGPLIGNQALGTQPIFAAAGIPQIAFAGEAQFTDLHADAPLSLRYGFQVPIQTAPLVKFAVTERNQDKLFILGQDSGFGRDVETAVRAQLDQLGQGELLGVEFHPFLNTDFATLMTRALASGANAIFVGTGVPLEIISAAREFALQAGSEISFYSQHTPSTLSPVTSGFQSISQILPADQLVFTWFYDGSQSRAFERAPSDAVLELETAISERFDRPASAMEGWGWGAVGIVIEALEALIESEGEAALLALDPINELSQVLANEMLTGRNFATPFGDRGFLPCGQFDQQEGVASFRDGEVFLLKDRGYAAELVGNFCP